MACRATGADAACDFQRGKPLRQTVKPRSEHEKPAGIESTRRAALGGSVHELAASGGTATFSLFRRLEPSESSIGFALLAACRFGARPKTGDARQDQQIHSFRKRRFDDRRNQPFVTSRLPTSAALGSDWVHHFERRYLIRANTTRISTTIPRSHPITIPPIISNPAEVAHCVIHHLRFLVSGQETASLRDAIRLRSDVLT